MRKSMRFARCATAVMLLAGVLVGGTSLTGCNGMNPVKTALSATTVTPEQKAELTAFAVYGSWVAVRSEAEVIVLDPSTPRRVQLAIKDVNRKAKPYSDAARDTFTTYSARVSELEAALNNPDKDQGRIDAARVALAAAKAAFAAKASAVAGPTADMRAALR